MKVARLLLLLVLAVLLPVRGAVAAAMLCPMASAQGQSTAAAPIEDGPCHQDERDDASPSDACHLCATFCSLTPLPSACPTLADPLPLPAARFNEPAAPAASFLSDGQERPPRRC